MMTRELNSSKSTDKSKGLSVKIGDSPLSHLFIFFKYRIDSLRFFTSFTYHDLKLSQLGTYHDHAYHDHHGSNHHMSDHHAPKYNHELD